MNAAVQARLAGFHGGGAESRVGESSRYWGYVRFDQTRVGRDDRRVTEVVAAGECLQHRGTGGGEDGVPGNIARGRRGRVVAPVVRGPLLARDSLDLPAPATPAPNPPSLPDAA